MTILPTVSISNDEKEQVKKLFESSLYFSGFESTRKASEGIYLLVTNKSVINKAHNEAGDLLQKFSGQCQSTPNKDLPERKKRLLIHSHVSSYAAALSQNTSQTPSQSMIYSPPSYKRPVSISFTVEATYPNKPWTLSPIPIFSPTSLSSSSIISSSSSTKT